MLAALGACRARGSGRSQERSTWTPASAFGSAGWWGECGALTLPTFVHDVEHDSRCLHHQNPGSGAVLQLLPPLQRLSL